jgi:misacylated tRNA(Ala) deacylase
VSRYLCHEAPEIREFSTQIIASEPQRLLLASSYLYPGGGGQLADRGRVTVDGQTFAVTGVEDIDGRWWHLHDGPADLRGEAMVAIASDFRTDMMQLHTALHLVNAFVYRAFEGALVTGVQMGTDRTARIDFDLPDTDNERIRALEPEINAAIAADHPVSAVYVAQDAALREPGLLRSRSVAPPPQPDGTLRVVVIEGLDRQACGGTHVSSTGLVPPIRIQKIDNKGRHNRRLRIGFV